MESKLFRALVGVGISLGAAGAACVGSAAHVIDDPSGDAQPQDSATPDSTLASDSANADAAAPNSIQDAAVDAIADAADAGARDAYLDPFCDAAWPTTKGYIMDGGGPYCGNIDRCGPLAPKCYPPIDQTGCDNTYRRDSGLPYGPHIAAWCVDGGWQCSRGSVPASTCTCWTDTSAIEPGTADAACTDQ